MAFGLDHKKTLRRRLGELLAITNGKIVTVTGETYENGTVLVEKGKITAVGANVAIPADAEVIDVKGGWVTPGFIDAHTHISNFNEPDTMPALCKDGNEMSDPITPQVRASDAINPCDYAIEKVRNAGFTTVCTLPGSANVCGGTGIVYKLRGHTAEEMIIPGTEQMKFALGENPKRVYGTKNQMPMTRMGTAALLRQTFYDAKNYSDALLKAEKDPSKAPKPDFKLDALVPVMRREMKCRIHAHRADDICTAIRICKEFDLDFSIEHATEGYKITDVLQKNDVTCVVGPHLWGPGKQEIHGMSLHTPAALHEAGITVCLTADSSSQTQFLPATVGILMVNGLDEQAAFEGVTINPARLLGVADKVGSIEVGKDADLAVFSGHPFSSLSKCMMTMIDGVAYNKSL